MSGWQPIETAPKDGTPFLTFSQDAHAAPREGALGHKSTPMLVMSQMYCDDEPQPVDEHGDWHDFHGYIPTHWMPLPEPPQTEQDQTANGQNIGQNTRAGTG